MRLESSRSDHSLAPEQFLVKRPNHTYACGEPAKVADQHGVILIELCTQAFVKCNDGRVVESTFDGLAASLANLIKPSGRAPYDMCANGAGS